MMMELTDDVIVAWMLGMELRVLIRELPEVEDISVLSDAIVIAARGGEGITLSEINRFRGWNLRWLRMGGYAKKFYVSYQDDVVVRSVLKMILSGKSSRISEGSKKYVLSKYVEVNGCSCPNDLFPIIAATFEEE